MKIYAFSGLGADKRVFQHLRLDHDLQVIEWIKPDLDESLKSYALRLFGSIEKEKDFVLLGLSFGGMIASEVAKVHHPRMTILLSSAETRSDLPAMYRSASKLPLHRFFPNKRPFIPRFMIHHLFGTTHKKLLNEILKDSDPFFTRWAISAILTWDNEERLERCVKISGTKDRILPPVNTTNILIEGGRHFMVVDRATEISQIINRELKKDLEQGEIAL